MKRKIDLCFAWSGALFVGLFFAGLLLLADWVPPFRPSATAAQVAARYHTDTNSFRLGMILAFMGCVFFLTFGVAVAQQTRRISSAPPILFQLQIVSVAACVIILILPIMIWWTAAFRTDRSPELVQLLNDLGCIIFVVGWVPYVAWALGTGLSILCDTTSTPLFPRWSGFLSLFLALIQIPAVILVYFHTGPFAWNGAFSWWLVLCAFFIWVMAMIILTVKAIDRPRPLPSADPLPGAVAESVN